MSVNRVTQRRLFSRQLVALALAGATLLVAGAAGGVQANSLPAYDGVARAAAFGDAADGANRPMVSPARAWTAHKPEALNRLFVKAINEGNVDAVVSLFEADAQLAPQPGATPVQGEAALRAVVEGWMALQLKFESSSREVIQNGDLALLRGPWQATLTGPDGQTLTQSGYGLEIARRQPDGSWRYVLGVGGE